MLCLIQEVFTFLCIIFQIYTGDATMKNICTKKIPALLSIFVLIFTLLATACNKKMEQTPVQQVTTKSKEEIDVIENQGLETTTIEVVTEIQTKPEPTTSIHDEYDLLLCKGTSNNGDTYCLVANESEDYTGTEITIGVIKNDKWLIEPTTDSPFLGDDGLFVNGKAISYFRERKWFSYLEERDYAFDYLGNGCFGYQSGYNIFVFNANTKKSYTDTGCEYEWFYGFICDEGKVTITHDNEADHCLILDTNNMTTSTYNSPYPDTGISRSTVCSFNMYAEGLMFIYKYRNEAKGFYDINGNLIIDMSEYELSDDKEEIIFKNGTCDLKIINDQGSEYKITVDKTGNVIASEKVS